jgi:putative toxin-antitoxin system antitoxin component (TIGR02293 family)
MADRIDRTAYVVSLAATVLCDEEAAREWLRSPNFGLGNQVPLEMLETEAGAREVEDLLGRIEHGVFS